jgi:hypothetical protein
MIQLKDGVELYCETGTIRPQTWDAIKVADKVYGGFGFNCIVTSVCDGKHSRNSKHYEGNGVDFRTRHVPEELRSEIHEVLANRLGPKYDVILEKTHIHVEFDPK